MEETATPPNPHPDTTTISTIVLQSGPVRLVVALLQSGEWITVKVVEAQPDLTNIGNDLQEASELQMAHLDVLKQLKSKATPVEELMRQVDEKVSSQRPEPEVYAAMAESLGTAWQSINRHLEHRKQILDFSVSFQTNFEQCKDRMTILEAACNNEELPIEIESAKDALTKIHDIKRLVLESVMSTLQEGSYLLNHLKDLRNIGTLDSRPCQMQPSIGSAIMQVETWLEAMHDRRKILEALWLARKNRLEECLALSMLAKDLKELEDVLYERKCSLGPEIHLGDSEFSASMQIGELQKLIHEIKELQERALKITRATEHLVKSECFAGKEASDKAYSVLGGCSDFINDLEMREILLKRAMAFFEIGREVLNQLDDYERHIRKNELTETLPRLTPTTLAIAVDDITHDVICEGRNLVTESGVENSGAQSVKRVLEEIENRAILLRQKCEKLKSEDRKISEALFAFQERQNQLSLWLQTIAESFLQDHQVIPDLLPLARGFYNLHHELLKDLEVKGNEINALLSTLPSILEYLDDDQRRRVDQKVDDLHERWTIVKGILERRLDIASLYIKFQEHSESLNSELDTLDKSLIRSPHTAEDKVKLVDERWNMIRSLYEQLKNRGHSFISATKQRESDPHLDTARACLCVETVLQAFAGREVHLTEQRDTWCLQITSQREVQEIWRSSMDQIKQTLGSFSNLDSKLYPVLSYHTNNAKEIINDLESTLRNTLQEVERASNEIQQEIKSIEELTSKDTSLKEETQPLKENLQQLQQNLNVTATDYQLLIQMFLSFFRNLTELDKSMLNVQSKYKLPLDLQTNLEEFSRDHEASKKIIMEMLKLIVNESGDVINKIRQYEPNLAAQRDIEKILSMLEHRRSSFDAEWNATKSMIDETLRIGRFDFDLQDINTTLDDLGKQLSSVRGQYGETLSSAKASSLAFEYFERTIELLQSRIDAFVISSNEMFANQPKGQTRVMRDLEKLQIRWYNFRKEISEVRRLIDLSMQYFKLVEEADDWFKEGNKLLTSVARKTTSIKTEENASYILSEINTFIDSGELKQNDRIQRMSTLARELYNDSRYMHLNKIQNENRDMISSFNSINNELKALMETLKKNAQDDMKRKQDVEDKSIMKKVETDMAPEQIRMETGDHSAQLVLLSESQSIAQGASPIFNVPLNDAVIPEGNKFSFECCVTGEPEPDISWYKDGMCIENNPDYKTSVQNGRCTLTIEETFTEDSARFMCKASNRYGSADTQATLSVRETDGVAHLAAPSFLRLLKPSTAVEGRSFQFECTVAGNPLPTVQWFKNDECVDNSPDCLITYNNGESVLRYNEVLVEHQGMYLCKATNEIGIDQCMAHLTVEPSGSTEMPKFIMPLSNIMARPGQRIKLECKITGKPQPQIQWKHNGKYVTDKSDIILQQDADRATLIIQEAFSKDAGSYTAIARNTVGEVTSSCNVSIKGLLTNATSESEQQSDIEPVKPTVQLPLTDASIPERGTVRFDCVIVGQPEPEVIWYHNNKPVKESPGNQLLFQGDRCSLIIRETYAEDEGEYKVVAINSAGEASSKCSLEVIKIREDEIAKEQYSDEIICTGMLPKFSKLLTDILAAENDDVSLECIVTGDPKPEVKWLHNNQEIAVNEHRKMTYGEEGTARLIIYRVQPDDKGVYTVKAKNSYGDAKCFSQLIVKSINVPENQRPLEHTPEIARVAPSFRELFADQSIPVGCSAKFECIVLGKPIPKIKWMFNNATVSGKDFLVSSSSDRQLLTIPSVSKDHYGTVSCIAENDAGKATCVALLSVIDSPHIMYHDLTPTTCTMNQSSFVKQEIMTQSFSKSNIVHGEVEPNQESHSVTSLSQQTSKQIDDQPAVITLSKKIEEYHKTDKEPASTREESLSSTCLDRSVGATESSSIKTGIPTMLYNARKTVPPRFISPLVGRIVDKGSDIVLEGIVDGYPIPEVKWTKNGEDLQIGGNVVDMSWQYNKVRIELKNIGIEDAGRFTCTATNSAGVASSTADIVIKKSVFPPVFGRRLQAQVVRKGERVVMEVEISGVPEPTVTWNKNNRPLQEAMSNEFRLRTQGLCHSLIIDKVNLEDSGKYMVRAVNAGGEAQSIADFAVIEPTPDTMLEVVKTVRFEDVDDQPGKNKTADIYKPTSIQNEQLLLSTDSKPQMTTSSNTESYSVIETRCTEQKFKIERETPALVTNNLSKLAQRTQTISVMTADKSSEPEPKLTCGMNTENVICYDKYTVTDKPTPCSTQTNDTTHHMKVPSVDSVETKLLQENITKEKRITPLSEVLKPITKDVTYPTSSVLVTQRQIIQSRNILHELDLKPGSPPQIGYMPMVSIQDQAEDAAIFFKNAEKMKVDEGRFTFPITTPETMLHKPVTEFANKSANTQQSYVNDSQTPTLSGNDMRSSSATPYTPEKGTPSMDGVTMDRIWAHKRPDSSLNMTWPPLVSDEEIEQMKPKINDNEPKLHYIANTIVCEKQSTPIDNVMAMDETKNENGAYKESKSEQSTFKSSNIHIWSPSFRGEYDLQAPQLIQKLIPISTQVHMSPFQNKNKVELLLEPGPEPEICFAPRTTTQKKQSQKEIIERDLTQKPSRVLPGAVRTIPPPKVTPTKEEIRPEKEISVESVFQPFPELEPFPFSPGLSESRSNEVPPTLIPSKFIKGEFASSDYESIIKDSSISSKWTLADTKYLDNVGYRKVCPQDILSCPLSDSKQIETTKRSTIFKSNGEISQQSVPIKVDTTCISGSVLTPGPAPVFVQPDLVKTHKLESIKSESKFLTESGYMADTEDTLRRSSYMANINTIQVEGSSSVISKNNIEKSVPAKFYRHHVHKADKSLIPTASGSQAKDLSWINTSKEIKTSEYLEPFPYTPEAPKPKRVTCPPPPSPSKFIKGEFRESDYESDYDGRIPPVWHPVESDTDELSYRPVRIALMTSTTDRHSKMSDGQKSPTPPMEFDNPPEFKGPPRPRFSPIEKLKDIPKLINITPGMSKQQIHKPKAVTGKPSQIADYVVAKPAIRKDTILQPGSPIKIGYVSLPDSTQYYTGTAGIPLTNTTQTETSQSMHFDESTEKSHRVVNISQTTRIVKFGENLKHKVNDRNMFPFSPITEKQVKRQSIVSLPKPKKFIPGDFRESDYESEMESTRIRAKWAPGDSDTEEPRYRKVKPPAFTRSASLPRSYGRVLTPMEFDTQPPVMPTDTSKTLHFNSKAMAQRRQDFRSESLSKVASNAANRQMNDMSEVFLSKVHRFADEVLTDVKQTKQKPILKTPQSQLINADDGSHAQAYREESRFAQYGTKHIDPDTGLIYFKYDFGYEFGILFPGEGRKILTNSIINEKSRKIAPDKQKDDIEVPVIHERSNDSSRGFSTLPTKKIYVHKNVKWDPQSDSEWSDAEVAKHVGQKWDQTPSPKSLSPSIPSHSPRYFYQQPTESSDRSCSSTPANLRIYTAGSKGEIAKPPIFITPLKDIAVVAGQAARFECIVQGDPAPTVLWAKNERLLQPSNNYKVYYRNGVCRFTIMRAYPGDAGSYTCTATNCAGAIGSTATLQVPGERRSTYLGIS